VCEAGGGNTCASQTLLCILQVWRRPQRCVSLIGPLTSAFEQGAEIACVHVRASQQKDSAPMMRTPSLPNFRALRHSDLISESNIINFERLAQEFLIFKLGRNSEKMKIKTKRAKLFFFFNICLKERPRLCLFRQIFSLKYDTQVGLLPPQSTSFRSRKTHTHARTTYSKAGYSCK
jgi:hypothetical protein